MDSGSHVKNSTFPCRDVSVSSACMCACPWQPCLHPYLGSTLRMRKAGLVSDSRSRFTGHSFSQQRIMSQRTEAGASVFTAFLQAWESETRKPAWRRADLGTKRSHEGEAGLQSQC